jgi:hypothetical protein
LSPRPKGVVGHHHPTPEGRDDVSLVLQGIMTKRTWAAADEEYKWNRYQVKITRLYLREQKTLRQVMQIMVQDDHFFAT